MFRCGDEIRLFGVILEDIDVVESFDHLIILLEVSEHDYQQAGVTRRQAQEIQRTFTAIDTAAEFRSALDGAVLDADDIF